MPNVSVTVDDSRVQVGLSHFRLSLEENQELMEEIGGSQLASIRRTFRGQGSPDGSWVPLAPSTLRSLGSKGAGHKLLVRSGRLLNSIRADAGPGRVTIGTSVVYAAVHQFGSRDRGGVAVGPVTEEASKQTVEVKAGSYLRRSAELGTGKLGGRVRRIQGPVRPPKQINRRAHSRSQNIPPRPYLVFRPEDPARIRGIVVRYVTNAAQGAGLGVSQ